MNTHKTYVAYDAAGVLDHENSNLKTFQQLHAWQRMHPDRFRFLNIDEIYFSSEHDDLVDSTVKTRLLALMAQADNLLVLVSPITNVESPILNWQISKAGRWRCCCPHERHNASGHRLFQERSWRER